MTEQTPDTAAPEGQTLDLAGKLYFHLVLADVIFETKKGVNSHRTQFMTQSPVDEFTAARIHQLQNSAAATVREKLSARQAEGFKVHDVLFFGITPCGYMTNAEFYGAGMTATVNVEEADASPGVDVTPPVAASETPSTDNTVVQFPSRD